MTRYVVRFDDAALRELDEFATYAAAYSEAGASEQFDRLTAIFSNDLAKHPLRYAFFHVTGSPYRGRLFHAGRRTKYWIVFTVDASAHTVDVLRFWNGRRDPDVLARSLEI